MVIVLTAPPTPFPRLDLQLSPLNLAAQNDHSPVAWLLCVSLINEYDLYLIWDHRHREVDRYFSHFVRQMSLSA